MFRNHGARASSGWTSLYDDITDKIIAELQAAVPGSSQGIGRGQGAARHAPKRCDRTALFRINVLILWGGDPARLPDQSWLTFRQALSLGGNVRKGEHGTTVVYADRFTPEEAPRCETGEDAAAAPFLALHRLQRRAMRRPAGRHRRHRSTAAAKSHRAASRL